MKNCIKYLFRLPILFSKAPLKLNDCFYNYHPQEVISDLALCGFSIIDRYQVGLFRIALIKKLIPIRLLVFVEKCINIFCSQINYAPSVYVVAKKCVDNSVDKVWISLAICNHLYYIDCHKSHFLNSHLIRVRPPSLIS